MCLYVQSPEPLYSKEDITCWKVLLVTEYGYETPFQECNVSIDIVGGERLFEADKDYHGANAVADGFFEIGYGYIHTFGDLEVAKALVSEFGCKPFSFVIYECKIPAGTEYYKSFALNDYASKAIKFVKRYECIF